MHILICARYSSPYSGNFIASMVELGRKLHTEGDTLFFVFPRNENTDRPDSWTHWLEREGHRVYLVDETLDRYRKLVFLKQIISDDKIDLIHIHFGLFRDVVVRSRRELKCRIIIHKHMEYPVGSNKIIYSMVFLASSLIFRLLGCEVICVNESVDRAHCLARHRYIPNGISLIRNVEESTGRVEKRLELGISPEEKAVLFLGWDLRRKGLDIAIRAIERLRDRGENAVLAVIGLGKGGEVCTSAADYVSRTTNIDPHTAWIRYLDAEEDMFSVHRAADVFLSSSRSEAFSYGIIEAISQNVPVVVSDIKGTGWSWEYDKAFVYPVEDDLACADAIEKAIEAGASPSNRDSLCSKYSIEKWCNRIISAYHS